MSAEFGKEIEAQSFKLIDSLLIGYKMPPAQKIVTRRVIHASAEPNYAQDLVFHPQAINVALKAIRQGKNIIVDSNMVKAGINRKLLSPFGGKIICRINNKNVIRESLKLNLTRAMLSMRSLSKLINGAIVAIGNAPTALFEVCDLVKKGKVKPALIIGLPVGFVGAVESKKGLRRLKIPYITNRSRKGGSAVTCAVVNALLILAKNKSLILFLIITFCSLFTESSYAMHISEGILPFNWATLWFAISLPFVGWGLYKLKKLSSIDISFKPLVGLMAAVVFIISCMPIPVPTAGTCSHPCGTGISGILLGPAISILITAVALLIQALFLAHGGLSTWGADIVSMGVMGSLAGFLTFRLLRAIKVNMAVSGFIAGLLADWATYLTTSVELAAGIKGNSAFMPLFCKILIAFIPTQLPLGILEGAMTAGVVSLLYKKRRDLLVKMKVIKTIFLIIVASSLIVSSSFAAPSKWPGVDETVVEKYAQEHGRQARAPLINTDQGDLLLFVFLLAGSIAGFAAGYYWRLLIEKKKL